MQAGSNTATIVLWIINCVGAGTFIYLQLRMLNRFKEQLKKNAKEFADRVEKW